MFVCVCVYLTYLLRLPRIKILVLCEILVLQNMMIVPNMIFHATILNSNMESIIINIHDTDENLPPVLLESSAIGHQNL